MIKDNHLLKLLCEDADMGRASIEHVMKKTEDKTLREVLERQHADYEKAYNNAAERLKKNGEEPTVSSPFTKLMAYLGTDMKTFADDSSSKIAELMIQGNTMGVTGMTKQIHEYDGENKDVLDMAHQQVKLQQEHIEALKKFL